MSIIGPNQLEDEAPPGNLQLIFRQLQSPLIYILIGAAIVTALLGEYIDMGVIVAVLIINTTIGFVQERQADRSVRALHRLLTPRATVRRAGRKQEISSRELAPGDLVLLESGQHVPADLRISQATTLLVDESLLTGESEPVLKRTDPIPADVILSERGNMAFAGTTVVRGRASGYVTATGTRTQVGGIATQMRESEVTETPLQRHISRLSTIIGIAVGISAALAFAIGLVAGEPVNDMFLVAVALAVSAVPEGLPVAFTITLAVGVRKMAQRNVIVRQLPAVETLGSTTVIGSDKTGTITQNRMTVQRLWTDQRSMMIPAGAYRDPVLTQLETSRQLPDPAFLTLIAGAMANEANLDSESVHSDQARGDPTEIALLEIARDAGIDIQDARSRLSPVADLPFEPDRRYSASMRCVADGKSRRYLTFVKGAPERVAGMCGKVLTSAGPVPIDGPELEEAVDGLAGDGLRVLAFAYQDGNRAPENLEDLKDLTLVGLQGLIDPPRSGVRDAIAECRQAGIRVIMITGDHITTAAAIGQQIGLSAGPDSVVDGSRLAMTGDDSFSSLLRTAQVFARVTPDQKLPHRPASARRWRSRCRHRRRGERRASIARGGYRGSDRPRRDRCRPGSSRHGTY